MALTENALTGRWRKEYLRAGMDDYVTKPIVTKSLFRTIVRNVQRVVSKEQNDLETDMDVVSLQPQGPAPQPDSAGTSAVPLFDQDAQDELIDAIGEDAFFNLLAIIPDEADGHLQEIEEAVRDGDLQRARIAAHTLKGMASSCTAIRIAAAAKAIEQGADNNDLGPNNVSTLNAAIEDTKDWLRKSA